MKKLFTILIVLVTASCNAQLFSLKKKSKTEVVKPDSIYLRIIRILTTVEDSVFHYEDTVTQKRYEVPECLKCIDTRGKRVGDIVVISSAKLDNMAYEASRMRKRKTSRKSDIEN